MLNIKKIVLLLFILCHKSFGSAQDYNDYYKNIIGLTGKVSSGDIILQLDFSYHYMICPYIGIGSSVGMWKQHVVNGIAEGHGWKIDESYEKNKSFFLRPSIHLASPSLVKISEGSLKITAEPGFMMNIPYEAVLIDNLNDRYHVTSTQKVSSNKGKWYAFECKIGCSYTIEDLELSIGYEYSDLDLNSYRRNMSFKGRHFSEFYKKGESKHGIFMSIKYAF